MRSQAQKNRHRVLAGSLVLIALLALITGIHWNDKRQMQQDVPSVATVNRIHIQRTDLADIKLHLTNEQWRIEQPCTLQANPQRLQPLLDALAPVTHGYTAAEVDLDAAGLNDPLAVVHLDDTRILIGQTDLSGERRYILRNERVEFVPEWILSLINGGLSALAVQDIFTGSINNIAIDTAGQNTSLSTEQLAQWQTLQAQQIVSWPLTENEAPRVSFDLLATTNDDTQRLSVHHFSRFSALHFENEQCAFILATDTLPSTAPR